jgi:hypothetical protein
MVDISGVHHGTVVVVAGPAGVVAHGWIPNCTVAGFSAVQSMLTQVRLEIRCLPHTLPQSPQHPGMKQVPPVALGGGQLYGVNLVKDQVLSAAPALCRRLACEEVGRDVRFDDLQYVHIRRCGTGRELEADLGVNFRQGARVGHGKLVMVGVGVNVGLVGLVLMTTDKLVFL